MQVALNKKKTGNNAAGTDHRAARGTRNYRDKIYISKSRTECQSKVI